MLETCNTLIRSECTVHALNIAARAGVDTPVSGDDILWIRGIKKREGRANGHS